METVMEDQEDEFAGAEEVLDISQLCRACASPNEYLIPIFHGEGLQYDLKHKVSRLPLQIKETDKLPVQLCYQCASTLIAFSDLVEGCAEADAKLKSLLPEGSSDPTTSLDDQTGLQSDEKSLGLQSSAASSIVETSQKVSPELNAEGVAEQDVSSMDQEDIAIEPMQQRSESLPPKQIELRNKNWKTGGATFCLYCAKMKTSFKGLIKHMKIEHNVYCEHCHARFVTRDQLLKHLTVHQQEELAENGFATKEDALKFTTEQDKNQCDPVEDEPASDNLSLSSMDFGCPGTSATKLSKCKSETSFEGVYNTEETKYKLLDKYKIDIQGFTMFQCDKCSRKIYGKERFLHHLRTHTGERPYLCSICGKSFAIRRALNSHHCRQREYPRIHKCGVCGQAFNNHSTLKRHKQSHSTEMPFKCEVCGKGFEKRIGLERHEVSHSTVKPYVCELCGKGFTINRALESHHCSRREYPRVHQCEVCGKAFQTNRHLERHKLSHSTERPYECEVCGSAFKMRKTLARHKLSHSTEKPYVCEVCGKRFYDKELLSMHSRIHKATRPLGCELCTFTCHTRQQLKQHARVHTGEKPYTCKACGKCFRVSGSLKRHLQAVHSGQRPYSCQLCASSFSIKRYLRIHMKVHLRAGRRTRRD